MSPAERSPSLLEAARALLDVLDPGTLALDVERSELEAFPRGRCGPRE